jgi:hypothetical protein
VPTKENYFLLAAYEESDHDVDISSLKQLYREVAEGFLDGEECVHGDVQSDFCLKKPYLSM